MVVGCKTVDINPIFVPNCTSFKNCLCFKRKDEWIIVWGGNFFQMLLLAVSKLIRYVEHCQQVKTRDIE